MKFINGSADRFSSKNYQILVEVMIQTLYHYSRKLLFIFGVIIVCTPIRFVVYWYMRAEKAIVLMVYVVRSVMASFRALR